MPNSVLDAIKAGNWDYEPEETEEEDFSSTEALPGSDRKLEVLAARLAQGLPLWHSEDRRTYNDAERD